MSFLIRGFGRTILPERPAGRAQEPEDLKSDRTLVIVDNPNRPISRLPPHILLQIFADCVLHRPGRWAPGLPSWISFSRVCRQWRDIALNSASLWAIPDFDFPALAHEMIWRRSRDYPLDLDFALPFRVTGRSFAVFLDALSRNHRLSSVVIKGYDVSIEEVLSRLNQPMPLLQTLELEYHSSGEHLIPDRFLGGYAPYLQSLHIVGLHIRFEHLKFKSLTSLKLSPHHYSADYEDEPAPCHECPTTAQLLGALHEMPLLQTLQLEHCRLPHDTGSEEPCLVHPVHLNHLRCLVLSPYPSQCANLLNYVRFPAHKTFIHIQCRGTPLEEDDLIPVFSSLTTHLHRAPPVNEDHPIERLSICNGGFDYYDDVEPAFSLDAWRSNNDMALRLHFGVVRISERLVHVAREKLPLEHLRELNIRLTECSAGRICRSFGSLPRLKTVFMMGLDLLDFVVGFGADFEEHSPPVPVPVECECRVPFPALETLTLHGGDFWVLSKMNLIGKVLTARAGHGYRLSKLSLIDCIALDQEGVDRIKEGAPGVDVRWDRYTLGEDGLDVEEHEYSDDEEAFDRDRFYYTVDSNWQVIRENDEDEYVVYYSSSEDSSDSEL
ncbi:hypothetical protein V5O48_013996 [Marasmius crinis-equi]|uniref:F-box domain-containing protein n=1 Tax=Marasmius crinis-equi TaxID=585013 RepID=A0ABR3EYJ7_9AGAR